MVDSVLRTARFFPVIADMLAVVEVVGVCGKCQYRALCDDKKKMIKRNGLDCDSFIEGRPQ